MTAVDEDGRLTLDALLEVMANADRRYALRYLRDSPDDAVSLEELVDAFRTRRSSNRDRHRLTIVLHHWVIPKLESVGVVEYDARSEMIRYRDHPRLEALLDSMTAIEARHR